MLKRHIKNKILLNVVETIIALAIALAVFFLAFNYVARTGTVGGVSMEPTLRHGEWVFINRLAYKLGKPKLGDIIAFPHPSGGERLLIKRVIGVAGDTVDYFGGYVFLNGAELPEEYRMEPGGGHTVAFPLTVPEGTIFVLGDNRSLSEDSRYLEVGCVDLKTVIGKVPFRLFPLNKIGPLH
ncbi:MAG: signal peptidase I [Clostridiales bacterium]|jgi:signal peptidase I|nr:signal peptidase I [Clostridiales bacterium]